MTQAIFVCSCTTAFAGHHFVIFIELGEGGDLPSGPVEQWSVTFISFTQREGDWCPKGK